MQDFHLGDAPVISASQWRQIVDSATETAIISIDRGGRVTSWNAGATHVLGWTEAEMLGQSLDRIFPPGASRLEREMMDAMAHGRGGGEENWRIRKDGSQFWAAGELTPIREGDAIVGFVKILRDRTQQRAAEEAVRADRRALEVLNRAGVGPGTRDGAGPARPDRDRRGRRAHRRSVRRFLL